MTNTKFKGKITMAATATIYSDELTFNFPTGKNAYRLDALIVQITDFDAIVAADALKMQFNYEDKAGGSYDNIDDKDEILSLGENLYQQPAEGTDAGNKNFLGETPIWEKLKFPGILYLDGRDFKDVFFVQTKAFFNASTVGQDASEDLRYAMSGQYVKLPDAVVDSIKRGVSLT